MRVAQAVNPISAKRGAIGPKNRVKNHQMRIFGPSYVFTVTTGVYSDQIPPMDNFDTLILDALQHNNRLTAEALSEKVGLSPDACRKRLAKLRSSDAIEQEVALLNPQTMGRGLIMIVEVTLQNERPAELDRFKDKMKAAPEVMQCYYVTGNADFILILSAKDMADYEDFTRRHFFAEENVARFRTSAVMDRVKVGFTMPIG